MPALGRLHPRSHNESPGIAVPTAVQGVVGILDRRLCTRGESKGNARRDETGESHRRAVRASRVGVLQYARTCRPTIAEKLVSLVIVRPRARGAIGIDLPDVGAECCTHTNLRTASRQDGRELPRPSQGSSPTGESMLDKFRILIRATLRSTQTRPGPNSVQALIGIIAGRNRLSSETGGMSVPRIPDAAQKERTHIATRGGLARTSDPSYLLFHLGWSLYLALVLFPVIGFRPEQLMSSDCAPCGEAIQHKSPQRIRASTQDSLSIRWIQLPPSDRCGVGTESADRRRVPDGATTRARPRGKAGCASLLKSRQKRWQSRSRAGYCGAQCVVE